MPRRRIVTGFNEQGKSIIISDGSSPASFQFGSFEWDELWAVDDLPAELDDRYDPADVERVYTLRPGAMLRASIVALPPESERQSSPSDADREEFARRVDVTTGVTRDPNDWKMHRTPTLDIIVVLSGELEMRLDSGQVVHLKSGDSVIQRGAMHAWQVLGDQPCVIVGFMMQGEFQHDGP